ncbi:hypothetical protein O6H91_17G072200 [Diphasiastrum complanatum]|uniref:Uncharacterized protein n=1 Tax=Diphasiastrum complanatum TaxID=34168 RepID=A0ACC2B7X6_DIPCM|nr:hypothetical protein O6H91_17G072200 [Diphasiastrum complanatum]
MPVQGRMAKSNSKRLAKLFDILETRNCFSLRRRSVMVLGYYELLAGGTGFLIHSRAWRHSLRGHSAFESVKRKRVIQKDVKALAKAPSSLSAVSTSYDSSNQSVWESFHSPTDTLLPRQALLPGLLQGRASLIAVTKKSHQMTMPHLC